MDILTTLKSALMENDKVRDRSQQVEIGASSIGGCRRNAWHIINKTPKTNHDTENLSSILGTAIHEAVAKALKAYDIFGDDFEIEFPLEIPELRGNCDFYSAKSKLICDWKSVTLEKISRGTWIDAQKKMQVNLYAYMKNQKEPGSVERVAICAIPRDGKFSDCRVWEDDYDPKLAEKGLAWLEEIRNMSQPPAPERTIRFCANYCPYYDATGEVGCPSK